MYHGSSRDSRAMFNEKVQRPEMTREQLMNYHILASEGRIEEISRSIRAKRQGKICFELRRVDCKELH